MYWLKSFSQFKLLIYTLLKRQLERKYLKEKMQIVSNYSNLQMTMCIILYGISMLNFFLLRIFVINKHYENLILKY